MYSQYLRGEEDPRLPVSRGAAGQAHRHTMEWSGYDSFIILFIHLYLLVHLNGTVYMSERSNTNTRAEKQWKYVGVSKNVSFRP